MSAPAAKLSDATVADAILGSLDVALIVCARAAAELEEAEDEDVERTEGLTMAYRALATATRHAHLEWRVLAAEQQVRFLDNHPERANEIQWLLACCANRPEARAMREDDDE